MLLVKEVSKVYEVGEFRQTALDNLSVAFRKNEFVSIVGPSGSGKTTLLNIIGGLDSYDTGDLVINNRSTKHFQDQEWDSYRNHNIGFVFQNYNLIHHLSVLENVEVGLTLSGLPKEERTKRALNVLEEVDLIDHINKLPNQLSGGQQQRVAIARALSNNPDIILADEPTGAIDSKTSKQIMELITKISKDKLVVMVTHDEKIAKEYSNRIITLCDGKIDSDSNPYIGENKEVEKLESNKTYMTFKQAMKLSFNNLKTKRIRTLITAFAGSIGIIGIALVLSLANGLNKEIEDLEKSTLAEFPIQVDEVPIDVDAVRSGHSSNDEDIDEIYELYTSLPLIYPRQISEPEPISINMMTEDYVDYVYQMNEDLYYEILVKRYVRFKVIKEFDGQSVDLTMKKAGFEPLLQQDSVFYENYDMLSGTYPENQNELLMIVDEYNQVSQEILNALGLDGSVESYDFNDFLGMSFEVILLDDYYEFDSETNRYVVTDLNDLYDTEKGITITITGIARAKEDAIFTILGEGVKYHIDLEKVYLDHASNSVVGNAFIDSNTDIFTGLPIDDATKEATLLKLGVDTTPRQIRIYPVDFEAKEDVGNYLDAYNVDKSDEEKIIYTDLASVVTELTGDLINGVSYVLIAFSAISLVVSSIMIGIITYVSVLERTKEIGVLRSLGARKKDITRVFNAEVMIIGFISGVIGVLLAYLLTFPINLIIRNYVDELSKIAVLPLYAVFALVFISVVLTLIAGFIPSRIASLKDPVEALRIE